MTRGMKPRSVVPGTGLEPARLAALDPKSSASANSAIPASMGQWDLLSSEYQSESSSGHKPNLQGGAIHIRAQNALSSLMI
jgi:hypothetical protein